MKNVTLICDLQFGSTGKGLIAGYLAKRDKPDVIVTAWSMNAGHTFIDSNGRKFVHCMLANGVVSPNLKYILIGPGSQIGIDRLMQEASDCKDLLQGACVLIHEHACIIHPRHIEKENCTMTGIGSTKKGCGAALIEKIERSRFNATIIARGLAEKIFDMGALRGVNVQVVDANTYDAVVDCASRIQVEGAQGYSLGINSGFYPFVTSRECTPAQIMTDCGIPLRKLKTVVGTMRTYPIRVANRYDDTGKQVGYSGPCYPDQRELDWEDIGAPAELTTVTQLPRRIFTFSEEQTRKALRACSPDEIFLNFMNYLSPDKQRQLFYRITQLGGFVRYAGHGPTVDNVTDTTGPATGVF
jgi:adenylosuccinate synthase